MEIAVAYEIEVPSVVSVREFTISVAPKLLDQEALTLERYEPFKEVFESL